MVVSEISDKLSPNIDPPTTAPAAKCASNPKFCDNDTAIGIIAAIVPHDVPIASEIHPLTTNSPDSMNCDGTNARATATAASTPPTAFAVAVNAPANTNTKHMIMMSRCPIPKANNSIFRLNFSFRFRHNAAADALDFERAARYRDQIAAMKKMRDKQKVVDIHIDELDVIAVVKEGTKGSATVLRFADSRLYDTENFLIDDVDDEQDFRSQFILRYYTLRNEIPAHIALDGEIEDMATTEQWLTDKKGKRVYLTVPQRGVQKNLVEMCRKNAFEALGQQRGVTGKQLSVLEELRALLGLEKIPEYIESYDISNLAGQDNVAGMVVFENARPLKSAYRKFKIKSFSGQDDYGSMAEVLTRRLDEYQKAQEAEETSGFGRLPDLILLDGGKGQVGAVLPIVKQSGLNIPVFGMVKDDHHRTRAIVSDSGEIAIRPNRAVFTFVTNIQDEVHRFSIGFNRQQRKKVLGSSLEEIPGIGKKRAKELLRFFRTIKNISNASLEELEQAPGMTHPAAVSVYNYYHEK